MNSSLSASQPLPELDAKIVAALERLSQALNKVLWDAAWQKEMSQTQAQVLLYILSQGRGGVTITDLARRFDLRHSTLSDAVRVLIEKGLLRRQTDPEDARAVRLRLSAKGRTAA
ncbi:MAG: MarR family transcriptional regulator, partial [Gemmatales bacterium]|nr:MarR family transcriptional regulator [Gemmatales bacterium]MDW8386925.1 MarR family transcriptional regulator [Gemmatales bacterium]